MIPFDDERWTGLRSGYRLPFDPRPLLRRLESSAHSDSIWHELWDELHHQGDVDTASYAAVPHLVRIYSAAKEVNWNTFALVATIENQRLKGNNPALPDWLEQDYAAALDQLAAIAREQFPLVMNQDTARAVLAVLALSKGLRVHATALLEFNGEELSEFIKDW